MKTIFKLSSLFLLLLTSCLKDSFEPNGIETRVFGRMYDSQNQLPLKNHKLRIGEYNNIPHFNIAPDIEFIQYIDSTTTDSEGYYDFVFTTTGLGDIYKLEVDRNYDNYFKLTDENVFDLIDQEYNTELKKIEIDKEMNYEILFFYPINLKITLNSDVQVLPIRITKPYNRSIDNLNETGIEINRIYNIDKNSSWQIILRRNKSNGQRQKAVIDMQPSNNTRLSEFKINISDNDFEDY